jgi:Co/Zn/Cd efflux system component
MGVVGAVVIARWSYSLLRSSAAVLLDVTDAQVAARVEQALAGAEVQIDDLHVWRIDRLRGRQL